MRIVYTVLFCCLLLCQTPIFALEISPRKLDTGELDAANISEHTLTIKNNEKNTVTITKLRSSCECIILENTAEKQLAPEKTLDITLQINPEKMRKGRFKKFIFIKAENSHSLVYSIEVTGNIL